MPRQARLDAGGKVLRSVGWWGGEGLDLDEIRSGNRARRVVHARRRFCQLGVKRMGYTGAEATRYLGATTSSVPRLANWETLPELGQYR